MHHDRDGKEGAVSSMPPNRTVEWNRGQFCVTCDPGRMDRDVISGFLATSYWASRIPAATVEKAMASSLCFALLLGPQQIGFARVISDYTTFAYLADVFVLPAHRGKGLSKWLVGCVIEHPDLQDLRRWMLATRDAHGLYERYGFQPLKNPSYFMERHDPDIYTRGT